MATELIHDRCSGPEISGTRLSVYNLLPDLLDPTVTENHLCRLYELSPDQVAAARAYILNNADTVLARHLEIEARMAAGNPPEVIERAKRTHATLVRFKEWLAQRAHSESQADAPGVVKSNGQPGADRLPSFRQWLEERQSETVS